MRRHAPTHPVLPALLLVVFMAALSLFAVPAVGVTVVETAMAAGPPAAKPETAAGDDLGRRATILVQGRAPPAAVR